MIALRPERWSWQKTTCSCPACSNWAWPDGCGPEAASFSWWGIANTLVTVATLLIPFRFLVEPGRNKRIACAGLRPCSADPGMPGDARNARCVLYQPVTDSRDDVVTLTPAFRGSGMSRYDSDGLRRVSPYLRAGVGVPRARPVPVGGLREFRHPAAAAEFACGRARRGAAAGHHYPPGHGARAGERARLRAARGWHYLCVPVADQAALPAG